MISFTKKILQRNIINFQSVQNYYKLNGVTKQQQIFNKVTPQELQEPFKMNHIIENTYIPGRTQKSQRSLFHGKQIKSGNQTCFSEKKTRRKWRVNIQKKEFYSDILQKKLELYVSTTAMRCMRKYGGFDNYILLTKSENMDSLYGEYLRKLMLVKLNNPDFRVPYIVKSRKIVTKFARRNLRIKQRLRVIHPKEIRHTDISHLKVKLPHEMNRRELEQWTEIDKMDREQEDMSTDHPYLRELESQRKIEFQQLKPQIEKAKADFENLIKNKKYKARLRELSEEAQMELENPPTKTLEQKKEAKKKKK